MKPATPKQRLVLGDCDYVLLPCEKEVLSMYLKIKRQRIIRYPGYISRQESFDSGGLFIALSDVVFRWEVL